MKSPRKYVSNGVLKSIGRAWYERADSGFLSDKRNENAGVFAQASVLKNTGMFPREQTLEFTPTSLPHSDWPMNLRVLAVSLFLVCCLAQAAEPQPLPKALNDQINRLVELFKESEGALHPGSVMTQTLANGDESPITLVVFTVEGFAKSNLYSQYLAAFTSFESVDDAPYFRLLDVVRIGGDNWREITALNATLMWDSTRQLTLIDIPVMEKADDEETSPNQPGVIHLSLDSERASELVEIK